MFESEGEGTLIIDKWDPNRWEVQIIEISGAHEALPFCMGALSICERQRRTC